MTMPHPWCPRPVWPDSISPDQPAVNVACALAPRPLMEQVTAVPHTDSVVGGSQRNGQVFLLSCITHERSALPSVQGSWDVDFDADGFAFAYTGSDGGEIVHSCDAFQLQVYETAEKEQVVVGPGDKDVCFVYKFFQGHSLAFVKLHCGAMQHEVALGVAIFDKGVGGGYCKWNLLKLFAAMGLADGRATMHLPGRWVASNWQAWSRKASQLRLPPCAVLKSVATDKNGGTDASEKDGRVLSWPSVSAPVPISLLARCCSLPRDMGGQKLASNRLAALEMLEAICRVCEQSAFELRVFVDESVKRRWPAEAEGVREVSLQVEIGGQVQARPLQLVTEGAGIISQAAWSRAVGDEPAISLLDLVRTCCRQEVRAVEL